MRVAVTGGTGFVGGHLAEHLDATNTVIISRRTGIKIDDVEALTNAFAGCEVVVHCAGINREIGDQTFARVHVAGTRAVITAAQRTGVKRIVMVSFLRARPDCGSRYHETKWAAEELIRSSGLAFNILKSGIVYGSRDHFVNHVSRALRTIPVFGTVGFREHTISPISVAELVNVLIAAIEGRITEPTIAVVGAEKLVFSAAIRRIGRVSGRPPIILRLPVWVIKGVAQISEWTMVVPLLAKAQVQMLAESVSEPVLFTPEAPEGIRPSRKFDDELIRAALPDGRFGFHDLRIARWFTKRDRVQTSARGVERQHAG